MEIELKRGTLLLITLFVAGLIAVLIVGVFLRSEIIKNEDYRKAELETRDRVRLEEESIESKEGEIRSYLYPALVNVSSGNYDMAATYYENLLRVIEKNTFMYYFSIAEIAHIKGDLSVALEAYSNAEAALATNEQEYWPDLYGNEKYNLYRSFSYFYFGGIQDKHSLVNYEKAVVKAEKSLSAAEPHLVGLAEVRLGLAYFYNEKIELAIPLFEQNLDIDFSTYMLGVIYYNKRDFVNSKKYHKESIERGFTIQEFVKEDLGL